MGYSERRDEMSFNSHLFLVFFLLVSGLYFLLPYRFRWALLLFSSYLFYLSWKWKYLIPLFFLTLVTYYTALLMGKVENRSQRKKFLLISIVSNLGCLFLLKYFSFFSGLFGRVPSIDLLLPVGISFYTFKNLSYSIDVYRTHQPPERHFGIYALYVAFFPQLLAGPIERAGRLLRQFHAKFDFEGQRAADGFKLIFWGLFQKVVIADTLSSLVDPVFNHPGQHEGPVLAVAAVFFAFQIYCDFSGYSDIAIGAAKVLGYETMQNFNRPYFATSIAEFWRRWHISLSTWLRDYLYIPLGGNQVSAPRGSFNLLVVFLLCGLWHGANWTFVLWGGLHGFYLILSRLTQTGREWAAGKAGLSRFPAFHQFLRGGITFFLVSFAWIFFRANHVSDALYIVAHLPTGWGDVEGLLSFSSAPFKFFVGLASIGLITGSHLLQRKEPVLVRLSKKPLWFRWAVYYGMGVLFLLVHPFEAKEFIYFQF